MSYISNTINESHASQSASQNILEVCASEAGQKLLQYLMRRLSLPQALLHRWIRTGQIRLNGGRAKPFTHVKEHDNIRIPPFAWNMAALSGEKQENSVQNAHTALSQALQASSPAHMPLIHTSSTHTPPISQKPKIIFENPHIFVVHKEVGLPVHTGTGHSDSLATRFEKYFPHENFKPTPAHRLDKDTSGLLLVARTYKALRALQDSFTQRLIIKEYLAWVHGLWLCTAFPSPPRLLRHHLRQKYVGYDEKVRVLHITRNSNTHTNEHTNEHADIGKEALSLAQCLQHNHGCSLMHIRLITGRKHQIRAQMAANGHPIVGDKKYGETRSHSAPLLYLHALRMTLPADDIFASLGLAGATFCALPTWDGWRKVGKTPTSLTEAHY